MGEDGNGERPRVAARVPRWLAWAREIQSLAQTGLHYAHDDFERARAERVLEIAASMAAAHSHLPPQQVRIAFSAQPGYVTPKVDVRGAAFRGDQILLVREPFSPHRTMPRHLADALAAHRHPGQRTVFD